jgi:4-hydroxy-tetrahydrodipicolinate synthase
MTMDQPTSRLAARLRGKVVPAVATPMTADGRVQWDALRSYGEQLVSGPSIGGLAVWAHTGRGLYLSRPDRLRVLDTWRATTQLPVVAGAGVPRDAQARDFAACVHATVMMAQDAAEHGADAVMVYPWQGLREDPHRDQRTLELHQRVSEAVDLPLLGFYVHAEAGGYAYSPALVADLLALPSLAGVKLATLDRAVACQDVLWTIRKFGEGRLAVTGEDRMFGPSLMWGADSALVGIAAAAAGLSTALVDSWRRKDLPAFVVASGRLDRFAAATFCAPIEGYVQRMLWAAEYEGLLPAEAAHDPYGPRLPDDERRRVHAVLADVRGR